MPEKSLKHHIGEMITEFFILRNMEIRRKKSDNSPFLVLELGYKHGRIWGHIWNNPEEFAAEHTEGDILKINGLVEKYKEMVQINIMRIRKSVASDEVYPEDLMPGYSGDMNALITRMEEIIESISDDSIKELLVSLLLEGEFSERFKHAPGGKLWHHGYIGGLLEHTLSVTELARKSAENYDDVDMDVLTAGALLHDIGKVDSYKTAPCIDYTDEGRLIGHIVRGYEIVSEASEELPDETRKAILHLILSHQGKLENASPVVPMTKEAIILYHVDEMDSEVNAYERIKKEQYTPGKHWSSYVNLADRFFYFGKPQKKED